MTQQSIFFFDGGCRPNPGPMEIAVVSRGQTYIREDLGSGDNNQAEWLALLFAVELATAQGSPDPVFAGDSMLVVQQAMGIWRCRSSQLEPYLAAFQTAVGGLPRVRVRHVRRSKNLAGFALARRRLF
jgi:ribonuclease HI